MIWVKDTIYETYVYSPRIIVLSCGVQHAGENTIPLDVHLTGMGSSLYSTS